MNVSNDAIYRIIGVRAWAADHMGATHSRDIAPFSHGYVEREPTGDDVTG